MLIWYRARIILEKQRKHINASYSIRYYNNFHANWMPRTCKPHRNKQANYS